MSKTLAQIKALIKAKLQTLVDGGGISIFKDIYDYPTGKFTSFPAIVIVNTGASGTWLDCGRNERTFTFTLELYQEQLANKTQSEADIIMTACADAILTAFDTDKDLAGEVEIVRVVSATFDFKGGNTEPFNFATFNIECVAIVPNY